MRQTWDVELEGKWIIFFLPFFVETKFRGRFANYEARLMIRIALSSASTEAQNITRGLFARTFFAGSSFSLERKWYWLFGSRAACFTFYSPSFI